MLYVSICLLIFGLFGWKCRSFHEDLINISDFILYIRGTKLIFTNLALYLKCHESQHFLNGSGKEQWQRIATQIQQNFFISCFMFFYADNLVSYLLSRYLKTISSLHWTKAYKTLTPRSCRTLYRTQLWGGGGVTEMCRNLKISPVQVLGDGCRSAWPLAALSASWRLPVNKRGVEHAVQNEIP